MPRRSSSRAIVWKGLFRERFVCLVRKGHPAADESLTIRRFAALAHVVVEPERRPGNPIDEALAKQGLERRIALRVPGFLAPPFVVAASDLVYTASERLALRFAEILPLAILPLPLPFSGYRMDMAWHEREKHDAGHAWFRNLVATVCATLEA